MGSTIADRLASIPRRNLGMRGESLPSQGETVCRNLADPVCAGRIFERALDIVGWSRKTAADELGYSDLGSTVSKWIAGTEPVQFARVLANRQLRLGVALAIAEACEDAEVRTVVTFRKVCSR